MTFPRGRAPLPSTSWSGNKKPSRAGLKLSSRVQRCMENQIKKIGYQVNTVQCVLGLLRSCEVVRAVRIGHQVAQFFILFYSGTKCRQNVIVAMEKSGF